MRNAVAFKALTGRTRYVRRRILDGICAKDGDKPFALMEPRHVRKLRDCRPSARARSATLPIW